jgi:hypothetical protein
MATGAVVCGRGTIEPAGGWAGDHHDGVPMFVLTRHKPDTDTGQWPLAGPGTLSFTGSLTKDRPTD